MDKIKGLISRCTENRIVMTLVGTLLFFILGAFFSINTGVELIYIYLQFPVLALLAGKYGAVAGMLVGLFGHTLVDLYRDGQVWWTWASASMLYGFVIGSIARKVRFSKLDPEGASIKHFNMVSAVCGVLIWSLYIPVINMLVYRYSAAVAFRQGFFATFSNVLTVLIVGDALMTSFKSARIRRVVAILMLVNSLLLISYGNFSIGSCILYVTTIVFCVISYLHNYFDKKFARGKLHIVWALFVVGCTLVLICFSLLFGYARMNLPTGNEKVMIVLGAGLDGKKPNKILTYRLDKAYEYASEHGEVVIITSGGQGKDEILPESVAMKNYLVELGIDESRIYTEEKSSSTVENFKFSLEVMKELGYESDEEVIVVTNDFHIFRSERYAKQVGYGNVSGLPAATPIGSFLPNYIRELLAIGKYLIK